MGNSSTQYQAEPADSTAVRLYYLDWLRLLATLGVFLFHVISVFSGVNFEIVNSESSDLLMIITIFFYPWGMPLFFLVAGSASWFALRRRTAVQFRRERAYRLLVPFLTGTILLGPIQIYLAWLQRTQTGVYSDSLLAFFADRLPHISPKLFGAYGYHMWFLGFLFAFSLLALPLFIWLKGESGRRLIGRIAHLCARRGGILIFILPPAVFRIGLQPFFPQLQDWADFFVYGAFFVLGFLVFSDKRFTQAIRRDWWILLAIGIASSLATLAIGALFESFDVESAPRAWWEFLMWGFLSVSAWCWVAFMLFIGMRYLDHDTKALRYGQQTLLPFFVVHQPVILAIAFFVVQWQTNITVKLLVVLIGSFVVSLGLVEFVIKRVGILRTLFGMKARQPAKIQVAAV